MYLFTDVDVLVSADFDVNILGGFGASKPGAGGAADDGAMTAWVWALISTGLSGIRSGICSISMAFVKTETSIVCDLLWDFFGDFFLRFGFLVALRAFDKLMFWLKSIESD